MRVPFLTINVKSKFFSTFRIPDSQKNIEKTSIWYFAVCLWWEPELLKRISKFPQNRIEVCESKEFSSRFPFNICDSPHSTHSILCKEMERNHQCMLCHLHVILLRSNNDESSFRLIVHYGRGGSRGT